MAGFIVYAVISTFFGFCGFVDTLAQPRRAFRNAGHSKLVWTLIGFVGMVSVVGGAPTFAIYTWGGIRRQVVRSGGFDRPRKCIHRSLHQRAGPPPASRQARPHKASLNRRRSPADGAAPPGGSRLEMAPRYLAAVVAVEAGLRLRNGLRGSSDRPRRAARELLGTMELDPPAVFQPQPKRERCPETPVRGGPRHRNGVGGPT